MVCGIETFARVLAERCAGRGSHQSHLGVSTLVDGRDRPAPNDYNLPGRSIKPRQQESRNASGGGTRGSKLWNVPEPLLPLTPTAASPTERLFPTLTSDLSPDDLAATGWPLARSPYLLETSRPGIFAVGGVRGGNIKRVASAVGEGSIAIAFVHQVLQQ